MANINDLYNFLDQAKGDRKYADNTYFGLKTAVRLFEEIMNPEEKASTDVVKTRIDALADDVFSKNKNKFSSKTVVAYKKRVLKVIGDYESYGSSAEKMAAWNPRRVSRATTEKGKEKLISSQIKLPQIDVFLQEDRPHQYIAAPIEDTPQDGVNTSRFKLRDNFRVDLLLPDNMTQKEADKVKQYIDAMVDEG
jgi:hypothetical protein